MDTPKLDLLSRAMQAYTWRMQATASNVANLDTPGYQRVSVKFEEALREARRSGNSEEKLAQVNPDFQLDANPPVLEDELMEMSDAQMRTQLASRALHSHFQLMRTAITGRTG